MACYVDSRIGKCTASHSIVSRIADSAPRTFKSPNVFEVDEKNDISDLAPMGNYAKS